MNNTKYLLQKIVGAVICEQVFNHCSPGTFRHPNATQRAYRIKDGFVIIALNAVCAAIRWFRWSRRYVKDVAAKFALQKLQLSACPLHRVHE